MARVTVQVQGLARTLQRLNAMPAVKEKGAAGALQTAGLLVQRRAMKYTPVEYGFLRGSAFTRKAQDGSLAVEVGFGAAYARFVHENRRMKLRGKRRPSGLGTYWNPGRSQFLRLAFVELRRELIALVTKAVASK